MKKYFLDGFYIKIGLWTLFCLGLSGFFNLLETKIKVRENEGSAVKTIYTIRQLQNSYASKHQGKFAPSFDELIKEEKLNEVFSGEKPIVNDYVFEFKVSEPTDQKPAFYSITADPTIPESLSYTETSHFYYDSTVAALTVTNENRPATAADPSI